MRTGIRVTMIVGAVALALGAGTAGALAATTGGGGADDPPTVVEDRVGTPAPAPADTAPRPTHDAGDDHGTDDPATHDAGDDHGTDASDDHGGHGGDD